MTVLDRVESVENWAKNSPQSVMERAFLAEYLQEKGYRLSDLASLPQAQAKALMVEASRYASLKLAQMESTAHLREKLHQ